MEEERKLTEEEFVLQAIKRLRKDPYRGIHSVYSGFNEAFRKYFGTNPVEVTSRLAAEGKIETMPFKGGAMLFLPGEAPKRASVDEIIQLISESGNRSLSDEEFIIEGIKKLRRDPYKGIHSVFSGLNEAFRKHFSRDPVEFTSKMALAGKVEIIPIKSGKGVMLYLPGEGPRGRKTDEALRKILG
jgi:Txe/YoeB family toxin of Txe-Axe toxin-antitoxin module